MTNSCLPMAAPNVVTNDFWLEYSIAGAFTLHLQESSMVAQNLKQLYYVKISGVNGRTGVSHNLDDICPVEVLVCFCLT